MLAQAICSSFCRRSGCGRKVLFLYYYGENLIKKTLILTFSKPNLEMSQFEWIKLSINNGFSAFFLQCLV